jgi:nitroreductase
MASDTTLPLSPDELLTTTRTVRKRLDLTRPVPTELIRECIDVAVQAPSGSNQQGWHWIVVSDVDQRAAIGRLYQDVAESYFASGGSAAGQFQDDPDRQRTQQRVGDSAAWLAEHIAEVPVLVIACITAPTLSSGNQAGLWGSLLPAAWSFCLAARARGLGTAWTSFTLAREAELAEILGLPDNVRHGVMLPTAYYTGETFKPARRQPLDEIIHTDRW